MKTTYTPLTELPQSPDISWRVNDAFESYVPLDQIGLNVAAVRGIAAVAGYYPEITVATPDRIAAAKPRPAEPEEDKPKGFSIRINGINADGTATGSVGMTRRRPPDLSNFATGNTNFDLEASSRGSTTLSQPREVLRIGLDVEYMTQIATEQHTLRDPQLWSRLISQTVRQQMLGATHQAFFTNSFEMTAVGAGYFGITAMMGELSSPRDIVSHGITGLIFSALASVAHLKNCNPDLHTGYMPFRVDRWAAAQTRLRSTRLTKPLPQG